MVFFWFGDADIDDDIEGSIWKVIDPAGNTAYVGDASSATTALNSYDATTGAITTAYDSAGRRFTYTCTSGMLSEVKAEKLEGQTWVEVGRVQYSYSAWFNGAGGCSGASSGTHTFVYETNGSYTDNAGCDTAWKGRTIVRKPDVTYQTASGAIKSYLTQYFDEAGQPLSRVQTDDDPANTSPQPSLRATMVTRNADGQITLIHSPANVTAYTHSTAAFTTSTTAGLVTAFTRRASGDMKGFVGERKHQEGTSGSAYLDGATVYTSRSLTVGGAGVTRPLIASRRVYSQEITSGTTGSFTYTLYTDGQLTRRIADAQTNSATDFASGDDPSTDFGITETSLDTNADGDDSSTRPRTSRAGSRSRRAGTTASGGRRRPPATARTAAPTSTAAASRCPRARTPRC